jgi:hypothetical protein
MKLANESRLAKSHAVFPLLLAFALGKGFGKADLWSKEPGLSSFLGTPTPRMADIADGVASGELTPSEAAELAKVVEVYRSVVQTTEIERRLNALEEIQNH